jgi:hypothetical protein
VDEFSRYVFETLRKDEEFVLERGQSDGDPSTILALAPVAGHLVPGSAERLEREYSLRDELGSDWAARPLTLGRREGRPMPGQTGRNKRARGGFRFFQGRAIVGLTMGHNGEYSPTECERGATAQNRT